MLIKPLILAVALLEQAVVGMENQRDEARRRYAACQGRGRT